MSQHLIRIGCYWKSPNALHKKELDVIDEVKLEKESKLGLVKRVVGDRWIMGPVGAAAACEPWPVTGQLRAYTARPYESVSSRTPLEPMLAASQDFSALDMPVVPVNWSRH